jgi:hypothetical protein
MTHRTDGTVLGDAVQAASGRRQAHETRRLLPGIDSVPCTGSRSFAIKDVEMDLVLIILQIAVLLAVAFGYDRQ